MRRKSDGEAGAFMADLKKQIAILRKQVADLTADCERLRYLRRQDGVERDSLLVQVVNLRRSVREMVPAALSSIFGRQRKAHDASHCDGSWKP